MLKRTDLNTFVTLVQRAERDATRQPGLHPKCALSSDEHPDDLLHRAECFQLRRSLKLASVLGDAPEDCHRILRTIIDALPREQRACLPLTHAAKWKNAIRWARSQATTSSPRPFLNESRDRESSVGAACRRLRSRGYRVRINAHGVNISQTTTKRIAADVDSSIARLGALDTLRTLFAFMGRDRRVHDGIWLFGTAPTTTGQYPDPAPPVAWLLSLALRHIGRKPQSAAPTPEWPTTVELATDFAASMDCQRYSQFEDLNAEPQDFLRILGESLAWRELFTLPQVPPCTLDTVRIALLDASWPIGLGAVRHTVDGIFGEIATLIGGLSVKAPTEMPRRMAQDGFPLLWRYALGKRGKVNAGYLDPFGRVARNHERFVFFEVDKESVIVLTPAMVAANGCEALFRLIWDRAGSAASDIVGETIEKSVAHACRTHTQHVREGLRYTVKKSEFEMDVVVQEREEVVLFETKAKSLTSRSRTGDVVRFIDDYTKSFLGLLRQLVRHERHIRDGRTPLDSSEDKPGEVRITKVAVSPLSYGPAADHSLVGILFRSMAQARLHSARTDGEHVKILKSFNKKLEQVMGDIEKVARRRSGRIDLFRYMHNVFWFDLGELLYVLQRGRSVLDALSGLRNLTFGTRDFWTEAAWADRQGVTKTKWHNIPAP